MRQQRPTTAKSIDTRGSSRVSMALRVTDGESEEIDCRRVLSRFGRIIDEIVYDGEVTLSLLLTPAVDAGYGRDEPVP